MNCTIDDATIEHHQPVCCGPVSYILLLLWFSFVWETRRTRLTRLTDDVGSALITSFASPMSLSPCLLHREHDVIEKA